MIRLQEVKSEERDALWNINQKYLYEMTKYYPDQMDERGNYHYGYFDAYFTDKERKVFFIYAPIKAERHLWRSQINELESQLTEV